MTRIQWLVIDAVLVIGVAVISTAVAEMPVQQSWQCRAGDVRVISNTPCRQGAQPVSSTTSVVYRCLHKGVSSFQQRPCGVRDDVVHLYSDIRSPATVLAGQHVRSDLLTQARAARSAQLTREGGNGGVTVVGTTVSGNRTAGDGNSDGYRVPNRSISGGSRY